MTRRKRSLSAPAPVLHSLRTSSASGRLADWLTNGFGTMAFLWINALFFLLWILINSGLVRTLVIFDPFPFNFLTMFVSLEAIFLSIIVLISQSRAAKLEDIREEIDFRVNVQAELEITKILHMLSAMEKRLDIRLKPDHELNRMKKKLNIDRIAEEVMRERLQH